MSIDNDIAELAAGQHGAVSTAQARLLGAGKNWAGRRVGQGHYQRATKRVLVASGSYPSPYRDALVAVLDAGPGAVLSHLSALALWDVAGFQISPTHVLRHRAGSHRACPDPGVHDSCRIPEHHITTLRGVPVTTPTRTCFDAAALLSPLRTARVVDRLWARRLTSGTALAAMRKELSRQGRNGLGVMDVVLATRGPDYVPPANGVEARLHQIVEDDGQPPLERQVHLHGTEQGWLGCVDGWDRAAGVVVEVDGDEYHTALTDVAIDEARRGAYRAMGLEVVVVSDHDVWHDRASVVRRVREARDRGRRRRAAG